jgi:hypothetical protein
MATPEPRPVDLNSDLAKPFAILLGDKAEIMLSDRPDPASEQTQPAGSRSIDPGGGALRRYRRGLVCNSSTSTAGIHSPLQGHRKYLAPAGDGKILLCRSRRRSW